MRLLGKRRAVARHWTWHASLVPDVVLLDITMPEGDGLETAAKIVEQVPTARVVMLTASEDGDDLVTAMKVGARGYVVKGAGATEVISAVRAVAAGEAYITPKMAGNLLLEMTQKPAENALDELTERTRGSRAVGQGHDQPRDR